MTSRDQRIRSTTASHLLSAAITKQPARPALLVSGRSYTYHELRQRIVDYQEFARRNDISADDLVLFLGEPGIDLYACLLAGVLGTFTVSLGSIALPEEIQANVIRRLNPRVIIGEADLPSPAHESKRVPPTGISWGQRADLNSAAAPHAYRSLTSGTTGRPTTALVDAHGLGSFCQWALNELELTSDDRWLEASDPSADLAITNALLAFASGACLVAPMRRERMRPARLAALHDITIMRVVPSVGGLMLAEAERRPLPLPALRVLAYGGDELPSALPARMLRAFQADARTLNTYGLTESAGFLLAKWFDARQAQADSATGNVPLGQPIPGVRAWVDYSPAGAATDDDPAGGGELVVRSATVALEVQADTEPTTVTRKSAPGAEGELRTGDLVSTDGDDFVFLGRVGRIVKVHGVRVNLGRLEKLVSDLLEKNVCLLKHRDEVVAVLESGHQVSPEEVARRTAGMLPSTLVPSLVISLHELPRTRSGKISITECADIVRRATGS